jgi:prophage antirepressor-like protein
MELIKKIDETVSFNEKNIRVLGTYEKPWFVANDICDILELPNITNALKILPEKWRTLEKLDTFGGEQNMITINEAGLYKLIMRSNKAIAQKFQEVVCEEILPSLRKKGEYQIQSILDKNKELEAEKVTLEEEKTKVEEENKKLLKKYVKKPKDSIDKKNVVYLMTTEESEKKGEYVVGKSVDLDNRKVNYEHNKLHDFKVIYYLSCPNSKIMDIVEATILMKMGQYRSKAGRDVFLLPDHTNLTLFTDLFDTCLNFFKDVEYVIYPKRTMDKNDKEYIEKEKERHHKYYEENKEKIMEAQKEYVEDNKEIIAQVRKEYYADNIEKIAEKRKVYYEENKEDFIKNVKEYYHENKEIILEERKQHYKEKKDEILEKRQEYYKKNYQTKIAEQRKAKEKCECGMIVSHYGMKRHKGSTRHAKSMEAIQANA